MNFSLVAQAGSSTHRSAGLIRRASAARRYRLGWNVRMLVKGNHYTWVWWSQVAVLVSRDHRFLDSWLSQPFETPWIRKVWMPKGFSTSAIKGYIFGTIVSLSWLSEQGLWPQTGKRVLLSVSPGNEQERRKAPSAQDVQILGWWLVESVSPFGKSCNYTQHYTESNMT